MCQFSEYDINQLRKEEKKAERRATLKASRDKINQGIADNGKRSGERAIWELIQNARDYSGDKPAVITIELNHDSLVFSHQGTPFTIRTIKDLILQQSTKHEGGDTVGQYGTGFMATHDFSRKVYISGDCKIGSADVYVPLPEGFCLDRSIDDEEGFIDEMESELGQIEDLFDCINQGHPIPNPNTVFTYPFSQDGKAEKVSAQITTTIRLMPFVLVFNDKIARCTIVNHITGETVTFGKNSRYESAMDYNSNVKIVHNTIIITKQSGSMPFGIRSVDLYSLESANGDDRIIIPPFPTGYDDVNSIPSQFLFFPLLGTENFGTGFVFHSKRLYPTEKRDSFLIPWDNDNLKSKFGHNTSVLSELFGMLFEYYDHKTEAQCLPVSFARISIERSEEDEPDEVRRNYLSSLQKWFADKFIHWKMIPTAEGFKSIQDDQNVRVLHKDVYDQLSEEAVDSYLPTIVSYASSVAIIPSEQILEWSKAVYSWNFHRDAYYVGLNEICESIKQKGDNLKSFLRMLVELERNDLLKSHKLIPNRDGNLHTSSYLLNGKEIPADLFSLAKPFMGEKADKLVDPEFTDMISTEYTRKDLQASITQSIENLRKETHKYTPSGTNQSRPRCLCGTTLKDGGPTMGELLSFCSTFSVVNPQDFRARLMNVICKFHDRTFAATHIAPLPDNDVKLYDSAFNYLVDETLLMLSLKDKSWFTDEVDGERHLNLLKDFLDVYTESENTEWTKKLDERGIFPNMLFEMCLPSELKKGANVISGSILDIYKEVAEAVGEKEIADYRAVLVHEGFSSYYKFSECKGSTITDRIEEMLREVDKDYCSDAIRKIVLKIIEKIDNGVEWPDESIFRDIRANKPTIFFKNTVSGDKGKHVYTLLRQDDKVIEDLAEMAANPDFGAILEKARALLQQQRDEENDFRFKKAIGNHIEKLLRERLGDTIDSKDYRFPDVQNGQDIVVFYKDDPVFYVEVKTKWNFTTSGSAYMSKNQVLKACEKKDCYALCCVDLTNYGLADREYPESLDRIMDRIKIKFEIGKDLNVLMQPSFDANSKDPENNISIDGDFKARIPAGAFRQGNSFNDLVSRIIEKTE